MPPGKSCPRHNMSPCVRLANLRCKPRFDSQTIASQALSPLTPLLLLLPMPGATDCASGTPKQRRNSCP
eukprot:2802885-Alexandrium_andersonii.AAC.1